MNFDLKNKKEWITMFNEKTLKNILSKDKDKKYPENLEF